MSLGTILIILLTILLISVLPSWRHTRSWGFGPSGAVASILLVIVVLLLLDRI